MKPLDRFGAEQDLAELDRASDGAVGQAAFAGSLKNHRSLIFWISARVKASFLAKRTISLFSTLPWVGQF